MFSADVEGDSRLRGEDEEGTVRTLTAYRDVVARNPDHLVACLMLAACYAETGRLEDARAAAAEVRRISPGFSLELPFHRSPYRDAAEIARQQTSLRAAGLD